MGATTEKSSAKLAGHARAGRWIGWLAAGWMLLALAARAGAEPGAYYAGIDASTSATLRSGLHALIRQSTKLPYTSSSTDTWDILETADQDPGNSARILDVYRNASLPKWGKGNNDTNREHTWPNSYGFPDDGPENSCYTDCHMLFMSDIAYNSARGNKIFGDCGPGAAEYPTDGGTHGVYPGTSNWTDATRWEVWAGRRGDVARAMFYMDVRYEGGINPQTGYGEPDLRLTDNEGLISTTGGNAPVAYMGLLKTLIEWNAQDPPDDKERRRNEVVESYQGNRNPFIDHPEWVARIYVPQSAAGMWMLYR